MPYCFPASKIGHSYENVDKVMENSTDSLNLDIIGKKIDDTFRWYASN